MADKPTQTHTPAEAQAELSARLNTVINHLVAQQTNAAPITPVVIAELRDIAGDIAKAELPPPPETRREPAVGETNRPGSQKPKSK